MNSMIPAQRQLNSHLSRLVVLHIHKLAYLSACLFTHRSSEHALDPSTRPRTEKKDDEGEGWHGGKERDRDQIWLSGSLSLSLPIIYHVSVEAHTGRQGSNGEVKNAENFLMLQAAVLWVYQERLTTNKQHAYRR